jgi:hypothetical protein
MKNRIKIFSTILIVLLITHTGMSQVKQRDKLQMRDRIAEELNLTEQQQETIDDLRLQNQKQMIDLKANLEKQKIALKELLQKGNYTRNDFLDRKNAIISAENQIDLAQANHHMDIYEQLDENQKTTWNKRGFGMHSKWEKHQRMRHKRVDVD